MMPFILNREEYNRDNIDWKMNSSRDGHKDKNKIIFHTNTIINPSTMMIKMLNTTITLSTMMRMFRGVTLTVITKL